MLIINGYWGKRLILFKRCAVAAQRTSPHPKKYLRNPDVTKQNFLCNAKIVRLNSCDSPFPYGNWWDQQLMDLCHLTKPWL